MAGSAVSEVPVDADLVVGADGIDSTIRGLLWPGTAAVYAGSTAWRGVTDEPWAGELSVAITWGRGTEFGMVPLGDGRVYWFAAVNAAEGTRFAGEARGGAAGVRALA